MSKGCKYGAILVPLEHGEDCPLRRKDETREKVSSGAVTEEYRANFDRIFGTKPEVGQA